MRGKSWCFGILLAARKATHIMHTYQKMQSLSAKRLFVDMCALTLLHDQGMTSLHRRYSTNVVGADGYREALS